MDLSLTLSLIIVLLKFYETVCGFPPSIKTPDKEVTVSKGETAVLKCDVENLYNYKVVWLNQYSTILTFEDLRFTDDNRFYVERPFSSSWNLHISNVGVTDQGNYTCSIDTNPVTSKTVNLVVSVPAKIRDELSSNDTVLRERETLVLVCNVAGVPRPFVTWYKVISGKEEKLDQTGEVLVISNVSRHDGGIYECRASNHANASKTISVTIKLHASVPTLNAPKTNVSVLEGKTTVLPCSFEKRGSSQIFWLGKHTALTLNERRLTDDVRFKVENTKAGQWNLVIENVTAADRGVYVCRVNSQPVTSKSVYLEVRVPAKIRDKLSSENTTLKEGQTLVLVCNVTGVPKPEVTWYKIDARNISKLNSTGEVLIITNVSEKDGGTYECLAFNGDSSSKQISVSVEFPPKVMVLSRRIGQFRGKGTILYCHITAKPQPDMYWLKGGEDVTIIVNSSKYQVEWTVKENTDYTLSLWIMDVQAEDFGEYTCYARNALGKAKDSVVLYDLLTYFKTPKSPKTSYQTVSESSSHNTTTDQFNVGTSGSTFLGHAYVYIALSSTVIIWTTEYENSFYSWSYS